MKELVVVFTRLLAKIVIFSSKSFATSIPSIIPIIGRYTILHRRNVVILRQSDTHTAHQLVHLQTTVYYTDTE